MINEDQQVQGSGAWLKFRQGKIGASDSPVIMGVSPYQTPNGLFRDKKGFNTNPNAVKGKSMNWAIERGNRWEPMARAKYEIMNDIPMEPAVLTHVEFDFLIASLDGWNADARRVLEIKIPGAEVFDQCKAGKVHDKYVYQLEHQLLVSQGDEAHFFCCKVESKNGKEHIADTALTIYRSNPELREKLIPKLHEFWGYMQRDEEPPICNRDVLIIKDLAAESYFDQIGILELKMGNLEGKITPLERAGDKKDPELLELQEYFSKLETEQFELKKLCARFLTHPKVRAGWVQLNQNKRFPTNWSVKIVEDKAHVNI